MSQYRDWDPHGHRLGAREEDDDYDLDELGHYEQVRRGLRRPAPGKVTLTQHLRYTPPPAGAAVQMKPRSPAAEATAAAWRAKDRASWGFLAGRYEEPLPTADPDAAVQAKSSGMTADPDEVHAAAAQGVQGSGEPLPHFEKIQKSFGAHDLSGVRAHIGGKAADAAAAIGASAFATGNDVAFEKAPDVRTAAHEAAHVVQQRAGVQLLGGVGEAGDKYERQADAVGDAVERGESAEELLGNASPGTWRESGTSLVQRQRVRATIVDQSRLPNRPPPVGVALPVVHDPMVSVTDQDSGECYELARAQVVKSASYVDAGITFIDPQGDPWTLTVDRIVFTNKAGTHIVVPWDGGVFASAPQASSFELSGGIYYPLVGTAPRRTFDATNTPEISRGARLVYDVIAELKQQRVEYAYLAYMFAGAIGSLGGVKGMVSHALAKGWARRGRATLFGRRAPLTGDAARRRGNTIQGGKRKGAGGKGKGRGGKGASSRNRPTGTTPDGENEPVTKPSPTHQPQQATGRGATARSLPETVRRPAPRHRASSVKQGSVARETNTVYDDSVDVAADVRAINAAGPAAYRPNANGQPTATAHGRTYVVENNGTLSPRSGPGFHTLTRAEYQALGVFNKFGDTDRAHRIVQSMKNMTPAAQARALFVWKTLAK